MKCKNFLCARRTLKSPKVYVKNCFDNLYDIDVKNCNLRKDFMRIKKLCENFAKFKEIEEKYNK